MSPAEIACFAVLLFSVSHNAVLAQEQFTTLILGANLIQPELYGQLTVFGQESVFLNRPDSDQITVEAGSQIRYGGGTGTLIITNTTSVFTGISTYQYVLQEPGVFRFQEFTTSDNGDEDGPGILFVDSERAIYSNSPSFFQLYGQILNSLPPPSIPPPQVEILTVRRSNQLVLNIDSTLDGSPDVTDDIFELTGSRNFPVSAGDSVTYTGNTVRSRRGSVTQDFFEGIGTFYVLEDVVQSDQTGRRFTQFSGSAAPVFDGPGGLIIGTLQGQPVGCYSSSESSNREIKTLAVDGQIIFDPQPENNRVAISDIFTTEGTAIPLVYINGCERTTTFPTAVRIEFNNGNIQIFDGFGQLLGNYNGFDLSAFVNNEITSFARNGGSGTITLPSGGLTLITNQDPNGLPGQGQAFAYSSSCSLISQRIAQASSQVSFLSKPVTTFTIGSQTDGSAILSASVGGGTTNEVVTVTDGAPIAIANGQFVEYDATTGTLRVYNQANPTQSISGTPISNINSLTVFETPRNSFDVYNSSNIPTRDIPGPGTLYYDGQGRAFLTNDQSVSNLIFGFVNTLPASTIQTRERTTNGTRFVDIVNGGRRLVELSTASTITLGSNQGVIYTDNTVRTVYGYTVAPNTLVVDGPSGTPGRRNLWMTIITEKGLVRIHIITSSYLSRQAGGTPTTVPIGSTLPGGGVLYFNPTTGDVLYNDDTVTSTALVNDLTNNGITFDNNIVNINELNFFDGRRVTRFTSGSTSFLQGPGSIYSSGSQSLFSTDTERNAQISAEISTILPVSVTVNSNTGVLSITSGTGTSLFTFTIGNTRTINVGSTSSVTYNNGVLVLPGRNVTTSSFTFYNGFETRRFVTGDQVTISGTGEIRINEENGEVIFITDAVTIGRVNTQITGATNNFRRPILVRPDANTLTTKFTDVSAFFGQTVNVYESSTVMLRCRITQGVPMPTFEISRNGTVLNGSEDRISITRVSPGEAVLTISAVTPADATRYGCRVNNAVGRDRAFTDIRVRPSVAPRIVEGFFPVIAGLPGRTITARTGDPPIVASIIVPDRNPGAIQIANQGLLVSTINLACKADGLPRSNIEWSAVESTSGDMVAINQSNIFVPRPGRSIYTVNLEASLGNTQFITYMCSATNNAGEATGQVRVEPESYACEVVAASGECSVTCGFGFQETVPSSCGVRRNELAPVLVLAPDIPVGLFAADVMLCDTGIFCPDITYQFDDVAFGDCSVSCGGGMQMRDVMCLQVVDGVIGDVMDDQNCFDFGLTAPASMRMCNEDRCPRWVVNSAFSPCSSTCAGGTRQRDVACMQMLDQYNDTTGELIVDSDGRRIRNDTVVEDSACVEGQMPRRIDACNIQIPCPHRWAPRPWRQCDTDFCQMRDVVCTRYDPTDPDEDWVLADSDCAGLPRLHDVRSCGGGDCSIGDWRASALSTCSVTCGPGLRTMDISCVNSTNSNVISDGYCNRRTRPADSERCTLFNCPGRCDIEPSYCQALLILRACKRFPSLAEDCCKSCPLQALPLVPTPVIRRDNLVINLDQERYSVPEGTDVMICCVASSSTTPNAFLDFLFTCIFTPDTDNIPISVNVGREIDNTACVSIPTDGLQVGEIFGVSLNGPNDALSVANVTITT